MAHLTIVVNEAVLRRARMRALEQGTSVNAVLRDHLESYARVRSEREAALANLLRLSKKATSRRGRRRWTRDDLHKR